MEAPSNLLTAQKDFSLLLFGASGHLARIKIFPALYFLLLKKRLPEHFLLFGYARTAMSDAQFRQHISDAIHEQVPAVNEKVLSALLQQCFYHVGQYDSADDFGVMNERLQKLEKGFGSDGVRLAYLSIPPTSFNTVAENLCKGGLHDGKHSVRIIVEKPLGHDEASAREIQKALLGCFLPSEIYLLDHYLGKEAARNIYYLRLINPVLERILKNTLVTNVQITASETAGLEGRAGYFEQVGALRDMVQSHLFQLMALLTMQLVERDRLPQARLEALRNIYVPPAGTLDHLLLQGQYARSELQHGYRDEDGVAADSRTATFVALKLQTRAARWQGVPFYLRTGKRLQKKETKIALEYQNPYASVFDVQPNRVEIILQGEAGMRVHLQTKMGGSEPAFRPLVLEDPLVCVGDCLDEHGLLLLEAINGKQDWFLDFEEVLTAWRLIDPLQVHLSQEQTSLALYPCGSHLPDEANFWLEREGYEWI